MTPRLKILHAIHDFLPRHRAGSEIYAYQLCRQLSRSHDVAVLCAEYDPSRLHGSTVRRTFNGLPVFELVNNWEFHSFEETYASPLLNQALESVLDDFSPDVLHIHSLLNLTVDLPRLARARGIASVATLHDYTLVCPSGGQRVHIAEQHVCRSIDPARCSRCFPQSAFHAQMSSQSAARLAGRSGAVLALADHVRRRAPKLFSAIRQWVSSAAEPLAVADIVRRLEAVHRMFEEVDVFVAPSEALGAEFVALGLAPDKLRVSDYGFMPLTAAPRPRRERLRIGFVGTLAWHKGAHVLVEAAARLRPDTFELLLYGDPAVFPDYVQELEAAAKGLPVRFMGGFDETAIAAVYASVDVLVVSSLWPENSPLVIHEAFMAGVPVVGSRQGGIPELVTHDTNGLLYEAYSSHELAAALQRLIDEPGLLERFAAALPAVKSIAEDAAEWEAVYEGLCEANPFRAAASP
jgi:glycosyltransferase involved in cell wall biosynthesis